MDTYKGNINKGHNCTINITADGAISYIAYTVMDLWEKVQSLAGSSLFYMQFLHPEVDWEPQKTRIERMCYRLAKERKAHLKDTPENRKWFNDWIEAFQNEVENQV